MKELEIPLGNPMLDGVNHGGGPAGDTDLVVDVLQVVLDCFPADDQSFRYPRHSFQQSMALAENGEQALSDHLLLPYDHLG